MSRKLIIYQIMTRLFGNKRSVNEEYGTRDENGVGKFNDINSAALEGIRALGATHVWYTGVIEHATLTDYTAFGIPLDDADVVKGRAGSPYAIKDYYDVNPDLAVNVPDRMREFEDLVQRTHQQGLKVIIDFVPNHVARAYRSDAKPPGVDDFGQNDNRTVAFARDNNFYYLPGTSFVPPVDYHSLGDLPHPTKDGKFEETPAKATGNDHFTAMPGTDAWFETVKLNYGVDILNGHQTFFSPVPDTWLKMRDILMFWTSKQVDGFRCDMAEMVPVEFWQWVIPQVRKARRELIFIAEIYNPSLYRTYIDKGCFDFLYDKVLLYDLLRALVAGHGNTAHIEGVATQLADIEHRMLRFMENHDEQRIASRFFAGDPWRGLPAMVVSATLGCGAIMVYFGQEVGEPALGTAGFQRNDGRTTIFDYWGVPEHQKWMNGGKFDGGQLSSVQKRLRAFYARLLKLAATNPAITEGAFRDVTAHNIAMGNFSGRVHGFLRFHGTERLLILTNFSDEAQLVQLDIPAPVLADMGLQRDAVYAAPDLLGGDVDVELRNGAFSLHLKPNSAHIFRIG